MKPILIILALTTILYSCGSQRSCYPSKRSKDYAVIKTDGNIIKSDYRKTSLVSVSKTMKGNKHVFVTDTSDTLIVFLDYRYCVGECYWVLKSL